MSSRLRSPCNATARLRGHLPGDRGAVLFSLILGLPALSCVGGGSETPHASFEVVTSGELGLDATPSGRYHVVSAGETANAIARRYRISLWELSRANGLGDANRIEIGQRLWIPSPTETPPGIRETRAGDG